MNDSRIAYPFWRLGQWLQFRRCRGCVDSSPHSHHLTVLGRLRWTRTLRAPR